MYHNSKDDMMLLLGDKWRLTAPANTHEEMEALIGVRAAKVKNMLRGHSLQ